MEVEEPSTSVHEESSLAHFILHSFLRKKKVFFLIVLATVLTNILSLATPLVLMQAYDRVISQQSFATLYLLVGGACTAAILEALIKIAKDNLISFVASQYEVDEGIGIVKKVLYGKGREINKLSVGSMMDSFNSINMVKQLVSGRIINNILDFPFVLIFLAVIFKLNYAIALYLLVLFIVYFFLAVHHKKTYEHLKQEKQKIEEEKMSFFVKVLSKIHSAKSLSFEERLIRKNDYLEKKNSEQALNIKTSEAIPEAYGVFFSQAVLFGILAVGSYFVVSGSMTIGVLTACVLIGNRFFQPVQGLIGFYLSLTDYQIAYKKVDELLKVGNEKDEHLPLFPTPIEGAICFKDIYYKNDKVELFAGLNLKIESKKLVLISSLHKSGASTLMRILLGQTVPDKGQVYLDNYEMSQFNNATMQGLISYVPEQGELFNGTVLENITMFDQSNNQLAHDCASMVGLDELISDLPQGYDTILNSRSRQIMPVGIIQRIVLARALIKRPRVLILDGIFNGLDFEGRKMLVWLIERLRNKMTLILVEKTQPAQIVVDQVYQIKPSGEKNQNFMKEASV